MKQDLLSGFTCPRIGILLRLFLCSAKLLSSASRPLVSDRYSAYKVPVKSIFDGAKHIRVQSFKDDISNNLIECFNKQFKAWYKTKQGFSSFESANVRAKMI